MENFGVLCLSDALLYQYQSPAADTTSVTTGLSRCPRAGAEDIRTIRWPFSIDPLRR
jgi:hypothetical protein